MWKTARLTAIGLAAALALVGCAGTSAPTPEGSSAPAPNGTEAPAEKITLTFANADADTTWSAVIESFEKANPNVTVKQLNIPYAQYTSTINQRLANNGTGIDIMVVDAGGALIDWVNRGFLTDISDMTDDAIAAAVSPDMVTYRQVEGKQYVLAPWTTAQFLYYNKDVLDAAGVEAPSSDPAQPWTVEQLTEAARKVKDAGAAQYPLLLDQWDSYYQMQMFGASAGGGDGIDSSGKVDFTNPGWQKALSWYGSLFEEGLSPRGVTNDKNGGYWQTGKAGFFVSPMWGAPMAKESGLNWGIAPAPFFEGGKPAISTDSWGLAVAASTPHADAAKEFVRYLTIDATGNEICAGAVGIAPTNAAAFARYVAGQNELDGQASAPFGAIMEHELQNSAVHRPNVVGYTVFEPGANQLFSDIRNGADPAERAAQADSEIASQIARLQ